MDSFKIDLNELKKKIEQIKERNEVILQPSYAGNISLASDCRGTCMGGCKGSCVASCDYTCTGVR